MPDFTSTTASDRTTVAVLSWERCKKYFDYGFMLTCGIPSVTLLGEVSDWEVILQRLDKLHDFGDEPTAFARMLRPVLRRIAHTFTESDSEEIKSFWNRAIHRWDMGSSEPVISGWMSAFCTWNEDGKLQYKFPTADIEGPDKWRTPEEFGWMDSDKVRPLESYESEFEAGKQRSCILDGISYPQITSSQIPLSSFSVPVKLNDNGKLFDCTMIAGSPAIEATPATKEQIAASNASNADANVLLTSVQPKSGWWMCINNT